MRRRVMGIRKFAAWGLQFGSHPVWRGTAMAARRCTRLQAPRTWLGWGSGADVNARNNRNQHPYDVAAVSNAKVRRAISDAGGVCSPLWDGESGRKKDLNTRRQGHGASSSRLQAKWRASGGSSASGSGSGSQPGKGASGSASQLGGSRSGV